MEEKLITAIQKKGPLTGSEILEETQDDPLLAWRASRISKHLMHQIVGTRYLRLDRKIEGFARLSPSIMREFLTYTVIGFSNDPYSVSARAQKIISHIEEVSRAKSSMAYSIVSTLVERLGNDMLIKEQVCFIIAGDIVFNMAHDVPRPERSTGKLVQGSDMDIVVVVDDRFPEKLMERLDEEIYKEKYSLLINPHLREEIDYIVKPMSRIHEQIRFDTFKHMVACKILQEGTRLYGSEEIFHTIKSLLKENGIDEKIALMEHQARLLRVEAEEYLLHEDPEKIKEQSLNLFYPTEESEEFE
ncbi:MAG: nucleotidyltransferase domain-containing protein [Deltaproteobacteria bacterium]|nr:nucleotidyltransferase domain-containing protein [Deltaproteobacteria bacterium]